MVKKIHLPAKLLNFYNISKFPACYLKSAPTKTNILLTPKLKSKAPHIIDTQYLDLIRELYRWLLGVLWFALAGGDAVDEVARGQNQDSKDHIETRHENICRK